MDPALAWAVTGLVLVIAELLTGTFYLLMLGIAAFGAASSAWLGQNFAVQAAVLRSEGEKQAAINKAQGDATAIRVIAEATAAGVRAVADAIGEKGGLEAANLKVAQQYIEAFANLAKASNTLIVPTSASDVAGFLATAMTVLDKTRQVQLAAKA